MAIRDIGKFILANLLYDVDSAGNSDYKLIGSAHIPCWMMLMLFCDLIVCIRDHYGIYGDYTA